MITHSLNNTTFDTLKRQKIILWSVFSFLILAVMILIILGFTGSLRCSSGNKLATNNVPEVQIDVISSQENQKTPEDKLNKNVTETAKNSYLNPLEIKSSATTKPEENVKPKEPLNTTPVKEPLNTTPVKKAEESQNTDPLSKPVEKNKNTNIDDEEARLLDSIGIDLKNLRESSDNSQICLQDYNKKINPQFQILGTYYEKKILTASKLDKLYYYDQYFRLHDNILQAICPKIGLPITEGKKTNDVDKIFLMHTWNLVYYLNYYIAIYTDPDLSRTFTNQDKQTSIRHMDFIKTICNIVNLPIYAQLTNFVGTNEHMRRVSVAIHLHHKMHHFLRWLEQSTNVSKNTAQKQEEILEVKKIIKDIIKDIMIDKLPSQEVSL